MMRSILLYNYLPKGRWIVLNIYTETLALWTDPEGDSCFSIYQISWIKIKKELFVNKGRHLEFVYVSVHSVSGIIFYDYVANSVRKFFSTDQ